MDLIFTIAGLLMTWSLANYLKRESRLLARLARKKPKEIYAFEVPFSKSQVLLELKHFVKRNHLGGTYLPRKNKPQQLRSSTPLHHFPLSPTHLRPYFPPR